MADLIDRAALLEKLNRFYGVEAGKPLSCNVIAALSAIDEAPAVDAEPVRHGRWVVPVPGDGDIFCSTCKKYAIWSLSMGYSLTKYCPNCGAKMDKEVAESAVSGD